MPREDHKRRRLDIVPDSAIADRLVRNLSEGHVIESVALAKAVLSDVGGATPVAVTDFASLGGPSGVRGNLERDLHRWLKHSWGVELELSYMPLLVADKDGLCAIQVQQPCIEPYSFLHDWSARAKAILRKLVWDHVVKRA